MAELLEHCWKLYRGKEEANEGDERARKSKTRIMELAASRNRCQVDFDALSKQIGKIVGYVES